MQFAELAKKIAELEAGEAQRSAQLQPLMARQPVPQAWPHLTSPGDKTAAGKYTRSYTRQGTCVKQWAHQHARNAAAVRESFDTVLSQVGKWEGLNVPALQPHWATGRC